jgi:hypothetical protein
MEKKMNERVWYIKMNENFTERIKKRKQIEG